jgi:hypothetical protein
VSRCFGDDPRSHCGVHPLCRHDFSVRGVYSHLEPSCFDDPCFSHRGSRPTCSNGEVQMTMKTSSCHMVKF